MKKPTLVRGGYLETVTKNVANVGIGGVNVVGVKLADCAGNVRAGRDFWCLVWRRRWACNGDLQGIGAAILLAVVDDELHDIKPCATRA